MAKTPKATTKRAETYRHDEEALLAVKVHQFEAEELGEPYAGVVEEPEDGAVSRDCAIGKLVHFSGRRAGQQEAFKLFRLDRADKRLAELGKGDAIEGIALNGLATACLKAASTSGT